MRCEFASLSSNQPQCPHEATRKYGEHWFCEQHGQRPKAAKPLPQKLTLCPEFPHPIPDEVHAAVKTVEDFFAKLGITHWEYSNLASRNLVNSKP